MSCAHPAHTSSACVRTPCTHLVPARALQPGALRVPGREMEARCSRPNMLRARAILKLHSSSGFIYTPASSIFYFFQSVAVGNFFSAPAVSRPGRNRPITSCRSPSLHDEQYLHTRHSIYALSPRRLRQAHTLRAANARARLSRGLR